MGLHDLESTTDLIERESVDCRMSVVRWLLLDIRASSSQVVVIFFKFRSSNVSTFETELEEKVTFDCHCCRMLGDILSLPRVARLTGRSCFDASVEEVIERKSHYNNLRVKIMN